jgi:hypothetical protein
MDASRGEAEVVRIDVSPRPPAPATYMHEVRTCDGATVIVETVDLMSAVARVRQSPLESVAEHFRLEAFAKIVRAGHPGARDSELRDLRAAKDAILIAIELIERATCQRDFGRDTPPPPFSLGEEPKGLEANG